LRPLGRALEEASRQQAKEHPTTDKECRTPPGEPFGLADELIDISLLQVVRQMLDLLGGTFGEAGNSRLLLLSQLLTRLSDGLRHSSQALRGLLHLAVDASRGLLSGLIDDLTGLLLDLVHDRRSHFLSLVHDLAYFILGLSGHFRGPRGLLVVC
jgi:hypothetical protein